MVIHQSATARCHRAGHGLIGVLVDISERKRMEEALRGLDRRKDEFLAMLGHELHNRLASTRIVSALLDRQFAENRYPRRDRRTRRPAAQYATSNFDQPQSGRCRSSIGAVTASS